jgi:hypothetical protein
MKFLASILLASSLYAGQSVSVGVPTNSSITARGGTSSTRVEFYLHDWGAYSDGLRAFEATFVGCIGLYSGANLRILKNIDGGDVFDISLALFVNKRMYVRIERDYAALTWRVEAWDENGVRQVNTTRSFTASGSTSNGAFVNASAAAGSMAFFRVHSTLVGANARPPVTFDNADRLLEWKFDNSLADSSGNGWTATGSPTYVTTPDQNVVSIAKVNATEWSNQTSIRAGNSATLSGTSSYSQADTSNSVTCQWYYVSGPSTPLIESSNTCSAIPKGTIFGSYVFQLTVTDVNSNSATSTIEVGAVATATNGVVIPADPNTTKIFGEMIAFGKSPWGYMDERAKKAVELNQARYAGSWPPQWINNMPGTISTDLKFDRVRTTLSADITSSTLTINVTSAAGLDLTTFPTIIGIGGFPGGFPSYSDEEVLICSAAGNVLTACFDGRGYSPDAQGLARAWTSGTNIYQRRVAGSSSAFLTNFCPAGAGWPGTILYNTGTVGVTAGSTTITGASTVWTSAMNGAAIRIQGTHSGGTPFVFQAYFTQTSATGGTLSRAYPSGADTNSGRSYHLISNAKYLSMNYLRADATTGRAPVYIAHCQTDTVMYWRTGIEYLATQGSGGTGLQSAITYSGDTLVSASNNTSSQYYDEVLAGYAMYFRSGWEPARTQARTIGDYWVKSPGIDEGYPNVAPRQRTLTGAFVAWVLDGRTDNAYGLRKNASQGAGYSSNCFADLRETAYAHSWTSLAALLDPDSGQRATWVALMPTALAWDQACKGASNSYPQYYSGGENGGGQTITINNGDTAATGTGIPASFCPRTAGGTASIVSGASQITSASISIASGVGYIVISGTQGGGVTPLILKMQYSGSGTTVQLAGVWPGDTGTINFQIESNSNTLTVSPFSASDPAYGQMNACQWNSSTSITLLRPYTGPSGTAYLATSNLVGVGTQPFIASIKAKQQEWSVEATTGATQTSYQTNLTNLANWIYTDGLDPATGGMYYGVNFAGCNPKMTAAASDGGYSILNAECSYWPNAGGKSVARPLLAEGASALVSAYEANPTEPVKAIIDQYYANMYGQQYASGVPSAEGGINMEFLFDQYLIADKWYGFFYGMGMAHQWPAVRVGGAQPESLVSRAVQPRLADISGAVSMKVTATRPSGNASSTATCTTSPCTVQIDTRQGTGWLLTIEYYSGASGTGTLLARATQPAGI